LTLVALGFKQHAFGFKISASISGYWANFQACGFRVQGSEFMVQGLGCWVYGWGNSGLGSGVGYRVHSSGFGVRELEFKV